LNATDNASLPYPQSLNLYSYVQNNPLSHTDPNGHCDVDGEHHNWLWCAAHSLQFKETKKETAAREHRFTLAEIVSWYRSKQRSLEGSGVSLVDIRERDSGQKPAAAADFNGANIMGRINGWVSEEFDFEAVRVSDGKDIFWRHVNVSAVDELEDAYADFLRNMHNPEVGSSLS
jgi:hypothetical protein